MDLKIIEQIKTTCKNKRINSYCNKILKKLSFNSSRDIGNVTNLVVLLYVFDMYEEAIKVADILDELEFTGNYTIWEKAVHGRAIEAKLLKEQGELERAENIMGIVISHLNPKRYDMLAYMLTAYDRDIQIAKKNESKSEVRDCKLLKLEMMLYFSELPDFPIGKKQLNNDILVLKEDLKMIVK